MFFCVAIQEQFNFVSSAIEDIHRKHTYVLDRLWHSEYTVKHSSPGMCTTPWFGSNAEHAVNQPFPLMLTPPSRSVTPISSSPTVTPVSSMSLSAVTTPMSSLTSAATPMPPLVQTLNDITNSEKNMANISPVQVVKDLPPIDKSKLISPELVVENYPKLLEKKKLTRLAIRLAQESFFGKEIMALCTVKGNGDYHALPKEALSQLKSFMISVSVPRFFTDRITFESTWKMCLESIGQSCKNLRS